MKHINTVLALTLSVFLFGCSTAKTPELKEPAEICSLPLPFKKVTKVDEASRPHTIYFLKGKVKKGIHSQIKCLIYVERLRHPGFSIALRNKDLNNFILFIFANGMLTVNSYQPRNGMFLRTTEAYFNGDDVIDSFLLPESSRIALVPNLKVQGYVAPDSVERMLAAFEKIEDYKNKK